MRWIFLIALAGLLAMPACDCYGPTVGNGDSGGGHIALLDGGGVLLADGNVIHPDGAYDLGDGAAVLPDGNVVPIPDGGITRLDAGNPPSDAAVGVDTNGIPQGVECGTATNPRLCECSDGIDQVCEDTGANGDVDEYDLLCAGPYDDRECEWATGINGDNMPDSHGNRECFFDGDSGFGNDDECVVFVPPGCDCYGCCEFDVNGDGIKEAVLLGGVCDKFDPPNNPQPGALGGACNSGDTCDSGLFCMTDNAGGKYCGPCEPCESFGGVDCVDPLNDPENCCANPCDESIGEVCFGDAPPEDTPDIHVVDGGVMLEDGAVVKPGSDGGYPLGDGAVVLADGAVVHPPADAGISVVEGGVQLGDGAIVHPPADGGYPLGDGAVVLNDGAVTYPPDIQLVDGGVLLGDGAIVHPPADGGYNLGDGMVVLPDGAVVPKPQPDAGTGDPRCGGLPYCGASGPCPTGLICYFACCTPIEG